ncbi:TonB-dependent receptor [soil metagenome]
MSGFNNTVRTRGFLLGGCLAAMLVGTTAAAQENDGVTPQAASDPSEIIVTAQRREERVQNVPISISAIGSEELAQRSIGDLQQLAGAVPGLFITGQAGQGASNLIAIRGISGQASPIGQSQTVAVYVDGQYLARPDAAFFSLDDVERLEVLRGPQGTLYGRNSTGGAINIITRRPGDELHYGLDMNYGNYSHFSAKGSLSGPLGGGFAAGVSGSYDQRDGYFYNLTTGHHVGDTDSYTLRGKLRYESPDKAFDAMLAGDISKKRNTIIFQSQYDSAGNPYSYTDPWQVALPLAAEQRVQNGGVTDSKGVDLTLNYKAADNIDLTSLTSYRTFGSRIEYVLDGYRLAAPGGAPGVPLAALSTNSAKTFTQELRSVMTLGDLKATLGANYYHEKQVFGSAGTTPVATVAPVNNPVSKSNLDAIGIFSQLEYSITDQLTLVGGLRFNHETRDFSIDYSARTFNPTGAANVGAAAAAPPVGIAGPLLKGNVKDTTLIPSAGLNFQATRDILLYAKFSRGYQAPGFNATPGVFTNGTGGFNTAVNTFKPETLDAYEVGVKSQFLDRRVTLNVAGFYYKYKDLQVRRTIMPGVIEVQNAAAATIKGAEGTLSFRMSQGLTLSGNMTYLDARYDSFCEPTSAANPLAGDPVCVGTVSDANRSGNFLINAPKWQGGVLANYVGDIGDAGQIQGNVSYSYQSSAFFQSNNEPISQTGKVSRVDARLGFQFRYGPEIYIYGKNLTDEAYPDTTGRAAPYIYFQHIADPRTYGVGVRYRY